jgi:hypothetical protein
MQPTGTCITPFYFRIHRSANTQELSSLAACQIRGETGPKLVAAQSERIRFLAFMISQSIFFALEDTGEQ